MTAARSMGLAHPGNDTHAESLLKQVAARNRISLSKQRGRGGGRDRVLRAGDQTTAAKAVVGPLRPNVGTVD